MRIELRTLLTNKKIKAMKKLRNIKIYVDGRSEEIQRKLFELDREITWVATGRNVQTTPTPFLYINHAGVMTHGYDMQEFAKRIFKKLTVDEILSMEAGKDYSNYEFEPLEPVLVRDFKTNRWELDLFSHKNYSPTRSRHISIGGDWEFCIPYKGNEHLLGTNKDVHD